MSTFASVFVIVISTLFVLANIGFYIYKKVKHLPTGECSYCHKNSKELLKDFYKMYPKKD